MAAPDLYEQVQLAAKLLGKKVYFAHQTPAEARICTTMHSDGSVEIRGMTGRFAPHLFLIAIEFKEIVIGQYADY